MLDVKKIRQDFSVLSTENPPIFLDGPGGTQVPKVVIDKMSAFMSRGVGNLGGFYKSSQNASEQMQRARILMQKLINAKNETELSFGANMTSLNFSLSRAICENFTKNDTVILGELDHEANISPWQIMAKEKNFSIKFLEFDKKSYKLKLGDLEDIFKNNNVKFLALGLASNICGTIAEVKDIIKLAHSYGAKVLLDGVHFIAHKKLDVQELDCDFLLCSAYKFCGPHLGILYAKKSAIKNLKAVKIAPAPSLAPFCFETGTQNFEGLAGLEACILHKASLNGKDIKDIKTSLKLSMDLIIEHENKLKSAFIKGLEKQDNIKIHGLSSLDEIDSRTPTFALEFLNHDSKKVCELLSEKNICLGFGDFYVPRFIKKLNLENKNGIVRVGFAYYNTLEEVEITLNEFANLA